LAAVYAIPDLKADDFVAKVRAAAQDEANALAACTGTSAKRMVNSASAKTKTVDQIVEAAFDECNAKAGAVTIALEGAPANLSPADAAKTTEEVIAGLKSDLKDLVKKDLGD
jgi:hypothetical protein